MFEVGKATLRRQYDTLFATRYFVGDGMDIGAGPDPLVQYATQYPCMTSCRSWDFEDGDAQDMAGVKDASLDFLNASHILEHLQDPAKALVNWLRILKPDGHLVIVVPDEDMYEQGQWPSTFNPEHQWSFTLWKAASWSPVSRNLLDDLVALGSQAEILRVQKHEYGFRKNPLRQDQTLTMVCEGSLEAVLRKR